jgi:hypothetical protein
MFSLKLAYRLTALSIAAGALGACQTGQVYDPHGYLERRDSIELSAGDANASNIAVQMVDPWPKTAGNKNIAFNGQRMQAAVERYRNNQTITPRGVSPSSAYGSNANNNPPPPANNNTPVGPTVAGGVK